MVKNATICNCKTLFQAAYCGIFKGIFRLDGLLPKGGRWIKMENIGSFIEDF